MPRFLDVVKSPARSSSMPPRRSLIPWCCASWVEVQLAFLERLARLRPRLPRGVAPCQRPPRHLSRLVLPDINAAPTVRRTWRVAPPSEHLVSSARKAQPRRTSDGCSEKRHAHCEARFLSLRRSPGTLNLRNARLPPNAIASIKAPNAISRRVSARHSLA